MKTGHYPSEKIKKVIGLMKDELGGKLHDLVCCLKGQDVCV